MIIPYQSSILIPSGEGWRITFLDAGGTPVASFWAETQQAVLNRARRLSAAIS